ncbi:hypothetical protein GCM10009844_22640 [Nocardioides koreensis]|uniref:Uncharacterized protein n=1 Tax=Nocardioides koreensis TaxID=433651 RepID=A0ABN2ZRW2_9ACTN
MQMDLWLSAGSSLLGAVIGAGAALGAQSMQWTTARKADAERERKSAIEDVLVRAQAVDVITDNLMTLAANAGSFNGLIGRVLGTVAPIDYMAMYAKLGDDLNALHRAAAQVSLFGDARTVQLTNAVVLAAADVVSAQCTHKGGKLRNYLRIAFIGRHSKDHTKIGAARQQLAAARGALVDHTRRALSLDHVDPFALPEQVDG